MKFLLHCCAIAVAAALGLGTGFAWRAKTGQRAPMVDRRAETHVQIGNGDSRRSISGPEVQPVRRRNAVDSPLATKLARDLSIASRVTRWLCWLEAIEAASLADFPRLAAIANDDPTAARLVATRWVQLDLLHLFKTLSTATQLDRHTLPVDELGEALFLEWARRDPDAAIAALQGTNGFGTRELWRFNVAGYLVETDPERGLRAISDWGIDNFAPRMSGVARWAAADPRHAAEVVLAHPAGYTSEMAMETIAKEWSKTNPAEAMGFATANPGLLAAALASAVLQHWAGRNLQQAADWLAQTDDAQRRRLSPHFVEAWAKTDPDEALNWCQANLAAGSLAQTLGGIVNNVAQKNLPAAAEFVAAMPPSPARAEAAAAVAKHWFPGWRSGQPAPTKAVAWLAGLDAASARRVLAQVQWKWSNGDPRSMAQTLATLAGDRVPPSADLHVARSLARQSPQEAFAWASQLPPARGLAAGREAFAEWLQAQPELAKKWLTDLPASDPRRTNFLP